MKEKKWLARRPIVSLLAFCVLATLFLQSCSKPESVGKPLGYELTDLKGAAVSAAAHRAEGKVVLLDVWGTWCGPCVSEIPHLNRLYKKYGEQGLEIVGVAFEKYPAAGAEKNLARFVEKHEIGYTIVYGGQLDGVALGRTLPELDFISAFPTKFLIGPDGIVRDQLEGTSPELLKRIEAQIADLLE